MRRWSGREDPAPPSPREVGLVGSLARRPRPPAEPAWPTHPPTDRRARHRLARRPGRVLHRGAGARPPPSQSWRPSVSRAVRAQRLRRQRRRPARRRPATFPRAPAWRCSSATTPGSKSLTTVLCGTHAHYPTGALGTITFEVERWADVEPGVGKLVAHVTPAELERPAPAPDARNGAGRRARLRPSKPSDLATGWAEPNERTAAVDAALVRCCRAADAIAVAYRSSKDGARLVVDTASSSCPPLGHRRRRDLDLPRRRVGRRVRPRPPHDAPATHAAGHRPRRRARTTRPSSQVVARDVELAAGALIATAEVLRRRTAGARSHRRRRP